MSPAQHDQGHGHAGIRMEDIPAIELYKESRLNLSFDEVWTGKRG